MLNREKFQRVKIINETNESKIISKRRETVSREAHSTNNTSRILRQKMSSISGIND